MESRECFLNANGMTFCTQEQGDPGHPAVLLIMGLGGQLTLWPDDFVEDLAARGYRVIRFDNRDIGLSSMVEPRIPCNLPLAYARYLLGLRCQADYSLYDMAEDCVALLDALGLDSAHLVGASMGGMIAQIVAALYPERVRSLNLMMTSCNEARVAAVNLAATWHLYRGRRGCDSWEEFRSVGLGYWRAIQSPAYPTPLERMQQILRRDFERSHRPASVERQIMAIAATGTLRPLLPRITHATQIIHGAADPLLKPAGARLLASRIRNARFSIIPGMGHDMPDALLPEFTRLIHRNMLRSTYLEKVPVAAPQSPVGLRARLRGTLVRYER